MTIMCILLVHSYMSVSAINGPHQKKEKSDLQNCVRLMVAVSKKGQ